MCFGSFLNHFERGKQLSVFKTFFHQLIHFELSFPDLPGELKNINYAPKHSNEAAKPNQSCRRRNKKALANAYRPCLGKQQTPNKCENLTPTQELQENLITKQLGARIFFSV